MVASLIHGLSAPPDEPFRHDVFDRWKRLESALWKVAIRPGKFSPAMRLRFADDDAADHSGMLMRDTALVVHPSLGAGDRVALVGQEVVGIR